MPYPHISLGPHCVSSTQIRSKKQADELQAWLDEQDAGGTLSEELGGALGVLRALGRAILVAGSKSYTHMVIALERYYPLLVSHAGPLGREVSDVWRSHATPVHTRAHQLAPHPHRHPPPPDNPHHTPPHNASHTR